MTQEEVRKLIVKYGKYADKIGRKQVYKMKCQGCGEEIRSDSPDLLGAVETKRHTAFVWHDRCEGLVMSSKIRV